MNIQLERENRRALIGERFPYFEIETTNGRLRLPDELSGRWFVLFSYPADFTPVCTTEFYSFSLRYPEFQKLNTELLALSVDQLFSHFQWLEWIKSRLMIEVPFPYLSDSQGKAARMLGLLPKGGGPVVRGVIICDNNGTIRLMEYYPCEIGRSVDEILRSLRALQLSDREHAEIPANWPENDMIGDNVIVPQPKDKNSIEEFIPPEESYSWWFSFRSPAY